MPFSPRTIYESIRHARQQSLDVCFRNIVSFNSTPFPQNQRNNDKSYFIRSDYLKWKLNLLNDLIFNHKSELFLNHEIAYVLVVFLENLPGLEILVLEIPLVAR